MQPPLATSQHPAPTLLQGQHTDRLLTATYLPANLAVVSAMTALHGAVRPRLRVVSGLLGFALALAAVTQVGTCAARMGSDWQ